MKYSIDDLLDEIATLPEFFDRKVDVNSKGVFGNYPIHAVCTWQDKDAVNALLANGADINSIGEHGETPIYRPVRDGNSEFVCFLMGVGAKVKIANSDGDTPFDIAFKEGFDDIANILSKAVL